MSQITRVPWGLQGFLGSKNQGQNPAELGQLVAPTLDLFNFYAKEKQSYINASVNITTPNDAAITFTPTEGETWLVYNAGMYVIGVGVTANDEMTMSLALDNVNNSNNPTESHPLAFLGTYVERATGSVRENFGVNFPFPVIMSRGEVMQFDVNNVTVTTGQFSCRAMLRYIALEN